MEKQKDLKKIIKDKRWGSESSSPAVPPSRPQQPRDPSRTRTRAAARPARSSQEGAMLAWLGAGRGAGHGPGPRGRAAPMARRAQARRAAPGRETCSVLRRRRPWPDPPGGSGEGAARRGARRTEPSRQAAKRALDPRGRSGIRRPPHPTHAPALRGDPARPRGQRQSRRCPQRCPQEPPPACQPGNAGGHLATTTKLNDGNKRKGKLSRYLRRLWFDAAYPSVSHGGGTA